MSKIKIDFEAPQIYPECEGCINVVREYRKMLGGIGQGDSTISFKIECESTKQPPDIFVYMETNFKLIKESFIDSRKETRRIVCPAKVFGSPPIKS